MERHLQGVVRGFEANFELRHGRSMGEEDWRRMEAGMATEATTLTGKQALSARQQLRDQGWSLKPTTTFVPGYSHVPRRSDALLPVRAHKGLPIDSSSFLTKSGASNQLFSLMDKKMKRTAARSMTEGRTVGGGGLQNRRPRAIAAAAAARAVAQTASCADEKPSDILQLSDPDSTLKSAPVSVTASARVASKPAARQPRTAIADKPGRPFALQPRNRKCKLSSPGQHEPGKDDAGASSGAFAAVMESLGDISSINSAEYDRRVMDASDGTRAARLSEGWKLRVSRQLSQSCPDPVSDPQRPASMPLQSVSGVDYSDRGMLATVGTDEERDCSSGPSPPPLAPLKATGLGVAPSGARPALPPQEDDNKEEKKKIMWKTLEPSGRTQSSSAVASHRKRKAGAVSDNFVRMDLKRKGNFRFKSKHKVGKHGGRYSASRGSGRQEAGAAQQQKWGAQGSRELTGRGEDALDRCLDALVSKQSDDQDVSHGGDCPEAPPPLCPRHQRSTRLLTVKKSGANRGRKFYACSLPRGEGCNFFMWAEDNPQLVLWELQRKESAAQWLERRQQDWEKHFNGLTVPELVKESKARGLIKAGKKAEVVRRLVTHCLKQLLPAIPNSSISPATESRTDMSSDEDGPGNTREDSSEEEDSCEDADSSDDELEILELTSNVSSSESSDEDEGGGEEGNTGGNELCAGDLGGDPLSMLRDVFGHSEFRAGQKWAIDRVLARKKALLVLATGSGKSLTYQLPALLLPGITVVVSPLVSLMEDQLTRLPPRLPGASMSGQHGSFRGMAKTLRDLRAGRVRVLFLSPERLCSPSFRRLLLQGSVLPPVSLLCVDEAHCASQWSHNFRPSYMRLRGMLSLLRPESVLALTATASPLVLKDVSSILGIGEDGMHVGSWRRENLKLHVESAANEEGKRGVLYRLLESPHLGDKSCIVYVWRQVTADALAELLKARGISAVAYHAGMEPGARLAAQTSFSRGRNRIIVATVAFGLGLDMQGIRGIIHFDMPTSIEAYVQEVGRAGRDGAEAHCWLFLCKDDFLAHHSLAHSNGLELVQVRALLAMLQERQQSVPHGLSEAHASLPGPSSRQLVLSTAEIEAVLDMKAEVSETLLSLLEAPPYEYLTVHGSIDDSLRIHFRKRSPAILARTEPVVSAILLVGKVDTAPPTSGYAYSHGSASASLVALAENMASPVRATMRELSRLQREGEVEYSLSGCGTHVSLHRILSDGDVRQASASLLKSMTQAEESEVLKVETIYKALAAAAAEGAAGKNGSDDEGGAQSSRLLDHIAQYLEEGIEFGESVLLPHESISESQVSMLRHDASILISNPSFRGVSDSGQAARHAWMLKDPVMMARAIARIFHGIGSPAFPSQAWRSSPFWGRYRMHDFAQILHALKRSEGA